MNPEAFESLPENRKVMMLKHLRSLVVAYDHLSDGMRRDLTTALEIIKNREVLNMVRVVTRSAGPGCRRLDFNTGRPGFLKV